MVGPTRGKKTDHHLERNVSRVQNATPAIFATKKSLKSTLKTAVTLYESFCRVGVGSRKYSADSINSTFLLFSVFPPEFKKLHRALLRAERKRQNTGDNDRAYHDGVKSVYSVFLHTKKKNPSLSAKEAFFRKWLCFLF